MNFQASKRTSGRSHAYQLSPGIAWRGEPIASKYRMDASLYFCQRLFKKPDPGTTPCERIVGLAIQHPAKIHAFKNLRAPTF